MTFQVTLLSLKKDALLASRSPAQMLQQLLPSLLKDEPGLHATGSMTEAPLGNIPAVRLSLRGSLRRQPGAFRAEVSVGLKDNILLMTTAVAPAAQFEQFQPRFATIMQRSAFLPDPLPAQRDQRFTAEEMAARDKSALVAITTYRDDKPLHPGQRLPYPCRWLSPHQPASYLG